MASTPLLQLSDLSLTFGGNPVFDGLSTIVQDGDRIALVGRNGSGKSTLLKVMAGLVEPDSGVRALAPSRTVATMEQDPDFSAFETLGDFAVASLDQSEMYRIDRAADGLGFDPDRLSSTASGGERRRAALAKIMAEAPDLMLLDEPTNHLDITAIEWLESELQRTEAAFIMISHDRRILEKLTRATLWIDRGDVRRQDKGFAAFEAWRDATWAEEDLARHKLDRKIKAEARWAVEGISARRKRNQGRVRALAKLREERRDMIARQGTAAMDFEQGTKSGRKVIELAGVQKSWGDQPVLKDVSLRVMRGDRLAIVGPNGAGKTTLLNIMTGQLQPDSGRVSLGSSVEIAHFDQNRAALDPNATLWDSLTGDKDLRVSGRADQVMVRGTPRHVVGYLKDFLFDDAQARAPVRSLSGGERARLLLAKLMAQPANVLVLDEPTNDLDIESLDLLQDILGTYEGTVLIVSHDRDFLDRVATATLTFERRGRVQLYAGGWSDMMAQRRPGDQGGTKSTATKVKKVQSGASSEPVNQSKALSFTEKHRLDALPAMIERLEQEVAKLSEALSDATIYQSDPNKADRFTKALAERQDKLSEFEAEWLELAERDDS